MARLLRSTAIVAAIALGVGALCIAGGYAHADSFSQQSDMTFQEEKLVAQRLPAFEDDWQNLLTREDLSEYERDVLTRAISSGVITQEDYEEGHHRYMQCMVDAGYNHLVYTMMPDGLYQLSSESDTPDGYFDQSVQCSEGTTSVIEAAFRDQQDNPQRYADSSLNAVQCLVDAGIVDEHYTAARFRAASDRIYAGEDAPMSEIFGFAVDTDDSYTLFCIAQGGIGLAFSDDSGVE